MSDEKGTSYEDSKEDEETRKRQTKGRHKMHKCRSWREQNLNERYGKLR